MNKLFDDNQKLVYKIIRDMHIPQTHHIYEDIVQAGMLGLFIACRSYDKTKGTNFSTHAYWYIRKEIQRCLASTSDAAFYYPNLHALIRKNHKTLSLDKKTTDSDGNSSSMYDAILVEDDSAHKKLIQDFFTELGIDTDLLDWIFLTNTRSNGNFEQMMAELKKLKSTTRVTRFNSIKQAMRVAVLKRVVELTKKPKYKNMIGEGNRIRYRRDNNSSAKRYIDNLR